MKISRDNYSFIGIGVILMNTLLDIKDLSINEVVNQSLQFAINDYEKNNNKGSK